MVLCFYYLYVLFLFQSVLRPTSIITLHFFRFSFSAAHGARVRNLPYFFTLCSGSISLLYRPESDSSYSIYETPLIRRIIQSYAQEQGILILDLNISKINWFLWLFVDFLRSSVACAGRTDGYMVGLEVLLKYYAIQSIILPPLIGQGRKLVI